MKWYESTFMAAVFIVGHRRNWFYRETSRHVLHPSVKRLLVDDHRPRDWHQLLLEWPHVAQTDRERLAYTRDERSGEADRQVITSVGKYLHRHFDLPDHIIRDAVALYVGGTDTYKMLHTVDEIVHAVNNGPHSCMCWSDRSFVRCYDGVDRHPYAVYDPQYGWHMAVRIAPSGDIVGRALLNTDDADDTKYWVRSFGKQEGSSYSHSDEKLEAWLKSQGYRKRDGWAEGQRLAYIPLREDHFLAPYLDGDNTCAELDGGKLTIAYEGEYNLRNTDGTPDCQGSVNCGDCGDRCNEDNLTYVGYHEDHGVCQCCLDYYTYATGRRGNQYYVHNDSAVEVDGDWYDSEYLGDNDIVELANGDYRHSDKAVLCTDDDEWYADDDEDLVYCEYDSQYHLVHNCVDTEDEGWVHKDDAWQCTGSDRWYSDNTDYVEIDDCRYHPDHTPAQEDLFNTEE